MIKKFYKEKYKYLILIFIFIYILKMIEKNKTEYKYIYEYTYHSILNIERLWFFLRDLAFVISEHNPKHFPIIILKGQDTWNKSNKFKGNLFGIFPFEAIVLKNSLYSSLKKISWLILTEKNEKIKVKFGLYKYTKDNTCIFHFSVKTISEIIENLKLKNENLFNFNESMENMEKKIKESSLHLFQYEGAVLEAKMEDLWEILIDSKKCLKICPSFKSEYNLLDFKIGEENKIFCNDHKNYYYIKIISIDHKPDWNKWVVQLLIAFEGNPRTYNQKYLIILNRINNNECHVCLINEFFLPTNNNIIMNVSKSKKIFLNSLKKYFINLKENNNNNDNNNNDNNNNNNNDNNNIDNNNKDDNNIDNNNKDEKNL